MLSLVILLSDEERKSIVYTLLVLSHLSSRHETTELEISMLEHGYLTMRLSSPVHSTNTPWVPGSIFRHFVTLYVIHGEKLAEDRLLYQVRSAVLGVNLVAKY